MPENHHCVKFICMVVVSVKRTSPGEGESSIVIHNVLITYVMYESFTRFSLCSGLSDACIDSSPNCADAMTTVKVGKPLSEEDMILLGEIKCDGGSQFASVLRAELLEAIGDPMLSMMELREEDKDPSGVSSLPMLVGSIKFKNNPKVSGGVSLPATAH